MVRSTASLLPRLFGLLAQLVTFTGFVVITAGLGTIQRTTNRLSTNPRAALVALNLTPEETQTAYETVYAQSLVQPYYGRPGFQFSYIWFIIFFQLAIFLFTLLLTLVPGLLHTCRVAALTLLAIACTLTITVVNNLVFMHKSPVANAVYGSTNLNVTMAGALLVVIGNGFTILALGIGAPAVATHHPVTKREGEVAAV